MLIENDSLVSVIIPCFNHARYVQSCIESVIAQDLKNIELIIIDDGSSDDSVALIDEMVSVCIERFVRFEFRSRANIGLAATLNEALKWCKGKYISPIASDDKMLSNKLNSQVKLLNGHEKVVAIYGAVQFIDDEGVIIGKSKSYFAVYGFTDIFLRKAPLYAPTAMYRKSELDIIGGYNDEFIVEDLWMLLKITENGANIIDSGEFVSQYRYHVENTSKNHKEIFKDVLSILGKYSHYPKYSTALARSMLVQANSVLKYDKKNAGHYLMKSIFKSPKIVFTRSFFYMVLKLILTYLRSF